MNVDSFKEMVDIHFFYERVNYNSNEAGSSKRFRTIAIKFKLRARRTKT
jgi:hypothetical protein